MELENTAWNTSTMCSNTSKSNCSDWWKKPFEYTRVISGYDDVLAERTHRRFRVSGLPLQWASCPRGEVLICRGCCPFVPQPALQPINLNHLVVTTGLFIPFNMTTFRFLDVLFRTLGDVDWSLSCYEVDWTSATYTKKTFLRFVSTRPFRIYLISRSYFV